MTADLGARFGFEMRSLLLRKSQELSLHQFDEVGVSSMITRTTSDITNLQQTMGMVLQMVVPAPLIVGASIVMTAMVTPVMAVIQVGFMAALAAPKVQRPLPQHPGAPGPHQPCGAGGGHRRAGDPGLRQ